MTTKRSSREQRMAEYVAEAPNAPLADETPEERQERIHRNWEQIKLARISALKNRNAKGVGVLDEELRSGRGTDFPHDAEFEDDGFQADGDGFVPESPAPARRAAQGDVRRSEPSMALIEQEAAERGFDNARRDWLKKNGGLAIRPAAEERKLVSEATGRRDPNETKQDAHARHAVDTGELVYGDSTEYNVVKPIAAVGGFAVGGPLGATAAEALVRATAIGYNLDAALDKGLDPEKAAQMFVTELSKGVSVDALFNFGAPVVGMALSKIPGLNRIKDYIYAALLKRLGVSGPAPRPELRDARITKLQTETADPARAKAVQELSNRVEGDFIPTPGQVAGKTGVAERRTREAFPGEFEAQEQAMGKAAEQMRRELVQPGSQPTQQRLGEQIVRLADETVDATKTRLRPVFDEANRLNIVADFNPVAEIARKALQKDAEIVGKGKLTGAERSHLEQIIKDTRYSPWRDAEAALDFVSIQKAMLRKLNPDGKPSPYFSTIVGDLQRAGNAAFEEGARRMGKHGIVTKLHAAREDYRTMMETAYDGAIKQAIRKGDHAPEDIGRYLWSEGKVTRIDELNELIRLAQKEGVASPAALDKLRRNVTRGFLQEAVQDVKSAANWSQSLADPSKRATWELLTRGPEGQALKDGMAVLEQAAQMATVPPANQMSKFLGVPTSRAVGGGLGISWVTLGFNPWLAGAGLSIAGAMRLMATAYTHGDKGTINLLAKVIRTNSAGTAASAKALQAMLPDLSKAAEKYSVTDLFMKDEQSEQSQSEQR